MGKTRMRVLGVYALVVALVGLMGAYFWMSYRGEQFKVSFQEKMLSSHDDLFAIYRGSGSQAWAVGKFGLIIHSNDGGRNWERQVSGTAEALTAVSFAGDQVGLAVGSRGTILGTRDGGLSWKIQKTDVKDYLLGVQALDETNAYAVGSFGTFLSTSDGGTTWIRYKFSWEKIIPHILQEVAIGVEPTLNALHFVTREIGWVVGEFGLILHTRDGGQTWTVQRSGGNLAPLFAIVFRDKHRGWVMGQQGTLIWTRDGGQHWLPSNLNINRDLYGASLEGEHMVLVGDRVFFRTKDGGSTWTRRDFTENLVLTGVVLMSTGATAVGQGGVIRLIE